MLIGKTVIKTDPIPVSAVIAIHGGRIKTADVVKLFAADYAPDLMEIIDARSPNELYTFTVAGERAQYAVQDLATHWPGARVCVVVTSGVVPGLGTPKPAIAHLLAGIRVGMNMRSIQTLNPQSIQRVASGQNVPYPNSHRETMRCLHRFVRHLLKPLPVLQPYVKLLPPK